MANKIDRNITVKEVLEQYPETAKVFQKYNLLIIGKSYGPCEPPPSCAPGLPIFR